MRVPTKFVLPLATLLLGLQFVPVTALAGNANRPGEPKSDVSPGESSSLVLVNDQWKKCFTLKPHRGRRARGRHHRQLHRDYQFVLAFNRRDGHGSHPQLGHPLH